LELKKIIIITKIRLKKTKKYVIIRMKFLCRDKNKNNNYKSLKGAI